MILKIKLNICWTNQKEPPEPRHLTMDEMDLEDDYDPDDGK